jgi:hypothetical protein
MVVEALAGVAVLFGAWRWYANRQGIHLVTGKQYAVSFTTPPGAAIGLGTTDWQPVTGYEPKSQPFAPNKYVMRATWTGPTDTFYAVNPAVAGGNEVTFVSEVTATK